jgi:molybdopterin/thiamine biosynthesis adenylyltransferase
VSVPPEQFARIAGRVNLALLDVQLVVIVGIGTVGSQIAEELANSGVGRLRLIDGDDLETTNLVRHVLSQRYVGMNKATALRVHLSEEVSTLRPEALPRYVDGSLSDDELDGLVKDADLIVAATDDRDTQRRLGRRALALDIPAVFPALYGDDGGEVVVQRSPRLPCFMCWDGFRTENERLRGVTALNADTLALIQLAVRLCLGVLDADSPYARLFVPPRQDPRARQLYVQNGFALAIRPIDRRPGCPACRVGPSRVAGARATSQSALRIPANTAPAQGRIRPLAIAAIICVSVTAVLLVASNVVHNSSPATTLNIYYPTAFRPCHRLPPSTGGAEAALSCHHLYINIIMLFYPYSSGPSVPLDREIPVGVPIFEPCPNTIPAAHAFYIGDERRGSLLCKYNRRGNVLLAWSDLQAKSFTKVIFTPPYDLTTAYIWWLTHAYEGDPQPAPAPQG